MKKLQKKNKVKLKKKQNRKNPTLIASQTDNFYKALLPNIPINMLRKMRVCLLENYINGNDEINWSRGYDWEILKAIDTVFIGGLQSFLENSYKCPQPKTYKWV